MDQCNSDEILHDAFEFSHFDQSARLWKTDDGKWYSLNPVDLQDFRKMIEYLNKKSKLGKIFQIIICPRAMDVIKSVLFCPSQNPNDRPVSDVTWDLLLNLLHECPENQAPVWNDCGQLLMEYVIDDLPDRDRCCMALRNIYVSECVCETDRAAIRNVLETAGATEGAGIDRAP